MDAPTSLFQALTWRWPQPPTLHHPATLKCNLVQALFLSATLLLFISCHCLILVLDHHQHLLYHPINNAPPWLMSIHQCCSCVVHFHTSMLVIRKDQLPYLKLQGLCLNVETKVQFKVIVESPIAEAQMTINNHQFTSSQAKPSYAKCSWRFPSSGCLIKFSWNVAISGGPSITNHCSSLVMFKFSRSPNLFPDSKSMGIVDLHRVNGWQQCGDLTYWVVNSGEESHAKILRDTCQLMYRCRFLLNFSLLIPFQSSCSRCPLISALNPDC